MAGGSTTRARRTLDTVAWAFLTGLVARLLVGQLLPVRPSWDGVIYERAARLLATGYGYTLRMYDPGWPASWSSQLSLPTAFYPPGWPATLALLKLLEGPSWLDLILQALLGALAIPLAAEIGGAVSGHGGARRAAWLVALWPGGWLISASWMGEPLFTLALGCAVLPLVGARGARPRRLGLASLLFGVAAYVRPTALAIAPFALVARAWAHPSRTERVAFAVAVASLALVAPAPWMMRNAERLSAPVVSSSAGANLYVGTLGSRFQRIPVELDCPAGPRELTRDRCRRDHALGRIASDPTRWILLGVGKVAHTFGYEMGPALQLGAGLGWSPPEARPEVQALVVVCSAYWLGVLGLAIRSRGRRSPRRVVWACVFGVASLHFVFLGGDRYHLPLVPLLAGLAASGLGARRALSSRDGSRPGRRARPRAPNA